MSGRLNQAKRVVVKIGSSLLTNKQTGRLNRAWVQALVADIASARKRGQDMLIVSSGAISLGRHVLGFTGSLKLEEKQAAAAAGQINLAHAFQEALGEHKINVAQILLTLEDTEDRRRYLNARNTINTLLRVGAVPVINENDTVATSEIRYGDNDRLAARVASMVSADCLVLLSDVDGLYTKPPGESDGEHLAEVTSLTDKIFAMAGEAASEHARGGMKTKLDAARIATKAGCHMVITNGTKDHPLKALEDGARATWFPAHGTPVAARKRWIGGTLKTHGRLTIDDGAVKALQDGRSLLPAGVIEVDGHFERGDAVSVCDTRGTEVAQGLTAYADNDARAVKGHKSRDIEAMLGYRGRTAMIHRDDLVLKGK